MHGMRIRARWGAHASPLALRYADSANWLWRAGGEVFKLARTSDRDDAFWQGAKALFGLDRWRVGPGLARSLDGLPMDLPMPPLPMRWLGRLDGAPLWAQPWCAGAPPEWTPGFAARLGQQCGRLHRRRANHFGCPLQPQHSLAQWPSRLQRYLGERLSHRRLPDGLARLIACEPARVTSAVPCLLDLRADQFVVGESGAFWIDWEALVWAPVEFDWALLEMVVPADCRAPFLTGYRHHGTPVPLGEHRTHCRAALFAMGALGELSWEQTTSIAPWTDELA
ncbi:hypothetical protein A5892_12660 [Halotalea alkalilenta]|uniref:Aminoglycoside phosphotransferase domain-containing protein n=2 Tax=Halotalea alkalilenta TaxID=376489 RepID=A0A172YGN4_9GAMM|nr:hypothetical protein A5892_12660 [Halotalea alkalilenta]